MALKRLARTDENVRLAELELQGNQAGMVEDRIAEERKSLEWVLEGIQSEDNQGEQAT